MATTVNFAPGLSLEDFRRQAGEWLDENAPEASAVRDRHDVSVFHNLDEETERSILDELRRWQQRKFDAGYGALSWPVDLYGAGLAPEFAEAFKAEEASRIALTRHELFSVTMNLIAPTVRLLAAEELRSILLPGLLDGSLLACQLFSEPSAGSDLGNISTKAVRNGDEWVVNGQKVWTSGAQFAQWGQAIVRSEAGSSGSRGLTTLMIPMDAPGVEIRQIRQMSGGTSFNEVFLTDVRVPDAYRVGDEGAGWAVTRTTLGFERANASNKIGVGGSYEQLVRLARQADALDRPDVRAGLADIKAREIAAEVALLRQKKADDAGQAPGAEGSLRKLQWVAKLGAVSELARSLTGISGVVDTGDLGTFSWNDHILGAPGYRIAGGTDQIQRSIIAERHLGLPPEPRTSPGKKATNS